MGLLGLENLLYFAKNETLKCQSILTNATNPKNGYCFAIVGIHLTKFSFDLFKGETMKKLLINRRFRIELKRQFFDFYCYLFGEFDQFWSNYKPESVMEFPEIFEAVTSIVQEFLNHDLDNSFTIFD